MNKYIYTVILAGGSGDRFEGDLPKQFIKISGKTVLEHTIEIFEKHESIRGLTLVVNPQYRHLTESIVMKNSYKKIIAIVNGGKTRQQSSCLGLNSLKGYLPKYVLIHDAVRPLLSEAIIDDVINALKQGEVAVDVVMPTADTIVRAFDEDANYIKEIPVRKNLRRGQTPQGFDFSIISKAHELAGDKEMANVTDDCGLILKFNLGKVFLVMGSEDNIKVTYPLDLYIADKIFQLKRHKLPILAKRSVFDNLENKTYIILGGKGGIGLAIEAILKEAKCNVVSFGRDVDVTNFHALKDSFQSVANQFKNIDGVINAAGVLKFTPIETSSLDDIKEILEVNLVGSVNIAKASLPYLKKTKGHLVFFGSSSYTRGRAGYVPYSCAKAGLVNFVQGLAEEVGECFVKVNIIIPERTKTPMRIENFGQEPSSTLLEPKTVAIMTANLLVSDITSGIIDVKKVEENKIIQNFKDAMERVLVGQGEKLDDF